MSTYGIKTDQQLEAEARKLLPAPGKTNSLYYRVCMVQLPEPYIVGPGVTAPQRGMIKDIFVIFTKRTTNGVPAWVFLRVDR